MNQAGVLHCIKWFSYETDVYLDLKKNNWETKFMLIFNSLWLLTYEGSPPSSIHAVVTQIMSRWR